MIKDLTKQIIRRTLQSSFDKEQFLNFIKNLLNHIDEDKAFHAHGYVRHQFKQVAGIIKTYERIGTYIDPEEKNIDILIVYLQKEKSIDRARTTLRNFVADYLKQRGQKDSALVAFVSPNFDDWRFSLIKMDYKFEEGKNGKIKVKEEFTSARRWSFLVGSKESSHTAQSRLAPLIEEDSINPTIIQLEDAFNIEKVTKEFFEKYRDLFVSIKESLDKMVEKDLKIKNDFLKNKINTVDFAKKLLGQIVFLYFLQKKGWFGVERDADWGTGHKNFLRRLFEKKHGTYSNFFNDILEPLFYEALRLERPGDYYSHFDCRIPFLNGGLFDPINDYDWWDTDILLPNDLFSNNITTKQGDIGNGILDIFDRYNFTVKEDEPLEKEVAIDPEMLGKVFENLLEVKDRKSKGTYYTPREIVHYMCQESLINYLATETSIDKDKLNLLMHFDTLMEQKMSKTKRLKNIAMWEGEVKNIEKSLDTIRIVDPACGSGAFLVGMMQEIIRLRKILKLFFKTNNFTDYEFKSSIIQNNLYGVDIDLSATEIAKLRLWLSLIVDEDNIKNIKPLPNLDYKIICGNSLSRIDRQDMFIDFKLRQIEELKSFLFQETNSKKKHEYRQQIDKLISEITDNHQVFDFEIYFSEVFHEKKGFDVVVANPPYVSYGLRGGQKMTEEEKRTLKLTFPRSAEYKISLYAVFMDLAIQIAKPTGGIQVFIVPDSFLLGRYFSKIREFILSTNEIISILLLPYGVFQADVGFSIVYLFQKQKLADEEHKIIARFAESNEKVSKQNFKEFSYPQTQFEMAKFNRFRLFFDKQSMNLISKIENNTDGLGTVIKFSSGLIAFNSQASIISKNKQGDKWLKGIISGKEIKEYIITPQGNFLLYDKSKIKSGYDCVEYFKDKLFIRQTGDKLVCAFDNDGLLALNNVHIGNLINKNYFLKFITSIINSRLMNFYYKTISLETGRVMAQTDIETIEGLPIKNISLEEQKSFVEIVDKILAITKSKDYLENPNKQATVKEYENQIDQMVYKLYGLTKEEIKIVEELKND